jgi:uncharacterized protein YeaO (DUF488 family)
MSSFAPPRLPDTRLDDPEGVTPEVPSMPPSEGEVYRIARELGVLSPTWINTGCLYEPGPSTSYRMVVMRFFPRGRRCPQYDLWWPDVAPSMPLLMAYLQHELSWRAFAKTYLAELDSAREGLLADFVDALLEVPARANGVTFLCAEHAPAGNESRVRCHRRLLRAWLLEEPVRELADA